MSEFNKREMILEQEKELKKAREMKAREKTKNSYNCFGLREYLVLFFALTFFLLPFISIFLLRANGGYNTIQWDQYYGTENYDYYTNHGTFEMDRIYAEFQFQLEDKTYQTIKWGSRHYQFVCNTSDDIVFCSQYTFPQKNVFDYFPFIWNLPIGITTFNYDNVTVLEKANAIIPSNWTGVWDNMGIYFYYVDEQNEGVAFHFGNKESDNEYRNVELDTDYGNLDLRVFDVNISGTLLWSSGGYPNFYYHNKAIDEDTYLNDYLGVMYGLFGNVQADMDNLIESLPFGGGGVLDVSHTLNYDSILIDISQCNGYPSRNYIPYVPSTKCGFYITIGQDFNLSSYLSYVFDTSIGRDIGEQIITANGETYADVGYENGITFYDGGLYLGKIISIQENLQQVLIYDLVILLGVVGILVIIGMFLDYPNKLTEFQRNEQKYCVYK